MSVKKGVFFSLPKKMSEKTSTTAVTLGKLAFLNLTHSSWSLLDAHIQYCIFPYHQALTVLQSKIRLHVRETRQKMDLFLSLLDGQNQLERLRPQRSVKYPVVQMIARITPGELFVFGVYIIMELYWRDPTMVCLGLSLILVHRVVICGCVMLNYVDVPWTIL
jgi:hypothetical protein